jgi:hypothetical protein
MALPPKGDPQRPLHLAIRSCRAAGGLFFLSGLGAAASVFLNPTRKGPPPIGAILGAIAQFGPGVAFYVLAYFLKKRHLWAVIVALVLASLAFVITLAISLVLWWAMRAAPLISPIGRIDLILLAIIGLVLLEMGRLIYQLARSFDAIRYLPEAERRGFESILPPAAHPSVSDRGK